MKKQKKLMLGLALFLTAGTVLASCGESSLPVNPTSEEPATTSAEQPTTSVEETTSTVSVEKVAISGYDSKKVLGGDYLKLTAAVSPSTVSQKVKWSSSDETLATVTNGAVTFANAATGSKVTITATSKEDETKFDSVEFEIVHNVYDLENSRGVNIDTSMVLDEDEPYISSEAGDVALVLADVHSSKWYVQADVMITGVNETDAYPKFGIMSSTRGDGFWSTNEAYDLFYYIDNQTASFSSGWNSYNIVFHNNDLEVTDWDWTKQAGEFKGKRTKANEYVTIGLLRNGTDYYCYLGTPGESAVCYKAFTYDKIGATEDSYAWIAGWNTAVQVANVVTKTGEEVDSLFVVPTSLEVTNPDSLLFVGDTEQVSVKLDTMVYDKSQLKFESSDTAVATVSETGLVTAVADGTATIKATFGSLESSYKVEVTSDLKAKVDVNGKMDDLIWSEAVKASPLYHGTTNENFTVYATRNTRGIYIFVKLVTKTVHSTGEWWQRDNIEFRFSNATDVYGGNQALVSTNEQNNFCDQYEFTEAVELESGLFEIDMEMFASYAKLNEFNEGFGASKDSVIGFTAGSNPGGGAWHCCENWNGHTVSNTYRITENGVAHNMGEEWKTCPDGHVGGEWIVDKEVTCQEDGHKYQICKYCGQVAAEETIVCTGKHVHGDTPESVTTPSTCVTAGEGKYKCTACGELFDDVLPLDPHNHEAWDSEAGCCTKCHEHLDNDAVYGEIWGGGWTDDDRNVEIIPADSTEDFTSEVEFRAVLNLDGYDPANVPNNVWETVCIALRGYNAEGGLDQVLTRMDGWGWSETIMENGTHENKFNLDADKVAALTGEHDVKVSVSRVASAITINYQIFDNEGVAIYNETVEYTLRSSFTSFGYKICAERVKFLNWKSIKVNGEEKTVPTIEKGKMMYREYAATGWDSSNTWLKLTGDLSNTEDWTAEYTYELQTLIDFNAGIGENCWRGALNIIHASNDYGNNCVVRADWCGWGGLGEVGDGGNGRANGWITWSNPELGEALANSTVHTTVKFNFEEKTLTCTYEYTCHNLEDKVYTYTNTIINVKTDNPFRLAISGEHANITVTSIKY